MTAIPLRINTPAGPVELTLEAEEGPVHVSTVAADAHLLANALMEASERFVSERGFPISCRAGCSACCRHLISVTPLEAFVLADAIAAMDEAAQAGIASRTAAVRERLEAIGLVDQIRTVAGEEGKKLVHTYFREQLPCPLLVDDCCSVYHSRPAGCRQLSVVSPAENCTHPKGEGIQRVPIFLDVQRALMVLSHSLFPDAPLQLPMPYAIEWVETHDPAPFLWTTC